MSIATAILIYLAGTAIIVVLMGKMIVHNQDEFAELREAGRDFSSTLKHEADRTLGITDLLDGHLTRRHAAVLAIALAPAFIAYLLGL